MKLPESNNSISVLIDKAYEDNQEPPRPHMGASIIGHHCDRWLWLCFRWAVIEKFGGRILRLFRRGQLEESEIISNLKAIGIVFKPNGVTQDSVNFGSHVSGSIDAVIERGIPEAPKARHIAEFKTHSKKSFDQLLKDGVQKSKPMHWAQMQVYMRGKAINRALYYAVCKDDDRIYTERVHYDEKSATQIISRAHRIALSDRLPEPFSVDPSWYQCKFCPAWSFCFETHLTKEVNCRTCAHSTATKESTFTCARFDEMVIPVDKQYFGCACHVLHPDLVPWQMGESNSDHEAVYIIDGKPVRNGEPDAFVFGSSELVANHQACANADAGVMRVRKMFNGRIEG